MRNILIILTLCLLTLTTSSVFAEGFDESKRSERLGLSFYDGRPLYVASFTVPYVSGYRSNFDLYRVNTGASLSDYGDFDSPTYSDCRCEYVRENGVIVQRLFFFYCVDDDGEPVLLGGESEITSNFADLNFVKKAFASATFTAGSGDVAIDIFDAMLESISEMLRGWLGIVLAIGGVMLSWNFICGLWTLDFSNKKNSKDRRDSLSYTKLSRYDRRYYEDAAVGSLGLESSQLLIPKKIKKDVDFVTGATFGLNFDEKTRESNRLLMEMFDRLSVREQKEVLEVFRESAFDKSFEDSLEKRFLAYQGEVFDDVDNPFTGRSKRRSFDPLTAEQRNQGYWGVGEDFGLETPAAPLLIDSNELFDPNDALDEIYYDENGGTPF